MEHFLAGVYFQVQTLVHHDHLIWSFEFLSCRDQKTITARDVTRFYAFQEPLNAPFLNGLFFQWIFKR